VDLKRATESGVIDVPRELLDAVVEASSTGEENRREIMRHVRECLAEPSGRRWRRVHAALLLVEALAKRGAPQLLTETAEGRHFDLVQRLSLLEKFECTTDKRVENMVRSKASALRSEVVGRLHAAGDDVAEGPSAAELLKDTASTCSPAEPSVLSCSTAVSFSSESTPPQKLAGQMILNGVVAVGHCDDTTSESSGGEAAKAVHYREPRRASRRTRDQRRASAVSSDSEGCMEQRCNASAAVAQGGNGSRQANAPAAAMDLLGL